jgi:hypothetical protein
MVKLWSSDTISMGAGSTVAIKPADIVFNLAAAGPKSYVKVFIWTKDELIPLTYAVSFLC